MSTNEKRDFDIVVFGASGVTGQYVIEELARHTSGIKWCVAGRSPEKLKSVLKHIGTSIGKKLDDVDVIEADVTAKETLTQMCERARLLINCVGPYRFSGEQVVEACVKSKTHHVDVSGEPQFLETVQLKYFDEAKANHIYVVGSCGFDSIPCDVGIETLRKMFNGDMDSVETFLESVRPPGSTVNFATWESAVHGLAHASELKPLRRELKQKIFTKTMPKKEFPLQPRSILFKSKEVNGWCIPFIGSDRSVVLRTQMFNFQYKNIRPTQIHTYMKTYSFLYALVMLAMGGIFMFMTKFVYGRYMLEKYPELFSLGVFSRAPPSREKASSGWFKMVFNARGWSEKLSDPADRHSHPPNKTVKAFIKGPDFGYISTAICVVSSAVVILSEPEKLPDVGGVFTPGAAFSETTLMKKLDKRGIVMQIQD